MERYDSLVSLARGPSAPAEARRYVDRHTKYLPGDLVDDLLLIVSELVGNAVQHGTGPITLRLRLRPPSYEVAVTDDGTTLPPDGQPHVAPAGDYRGRGLLLVDRIAGAWGVTPAPVTAGKTVWATIWRWPDAADE